MKIIANMKFLFAIPNLSAGGMQRVMSELITYFSKHTKLEIHLLLYGKNPDIFYPIPPSVIIHRHNLTYKNRYRIVYTLQTIYYIRKEVKYIKPQKILNFGELWNSLFLLSTLRLKIPIYISDRCSPMKEFGFFQENIKKWLYPKAAGVIIQTSIAESIYRKRYQLSKLVIIENPIRNIPQNKNIKRNNWVLSIGRMIHTKHFDRLITMFANIRETGWELIIIGDDANKQKNHKRLAELAYKLKIQDKVHLLGYLKNVDEYLLKSKIFAFTSSSEGFPNVIAEAMSAGLPVISYNCIAGPSDIIDNEKNGYLVPVFNDQEFEERLKFLIKNNTIREIMGNNAKQTIRSLYPEKICQKYIHYIFNKNENTAN